MQKLAAKDRPAAFDTLKKYVLEDCRFSSSLAVVRVCVPEQGEEEPVQNDDGKNIRVKKGEGVLSNVVSLFSASSSPVGCGRLITVSARL